MSDPTLSSTLQLMLVDADPVFRLGLKTGLAAFPQVQVVSEAAQAHQVWPQLNQFQIKAPTPEAVREPLHPPIPSELPRLNLLILDVRLEPEDTGAGLMLCQQLRVQYPNLPVVILTSDRTSTALTTAKQAGVNGYWLKGTAVSDLVTALLQIAQGKQVWDPQVLRPAPMPASASVEPPTPRWRAFKQLRQQLRDLSMARLSIRQAHLDSRLDELPISWYERQVVAGLQRELKVAHWCLDRWLPPLVAASSAPDMTLDGEAADDLPPNLEPLVSAAAEPTGPLAMTETALESTNADYQFQAGKRLLLDGILAKLPANLHNQTQIPLELDILNIQKKQDLLILILKRFEDLLDELRFSQVPPVALAERRSQLLLDLWQASLTDFYGKYMTISMAPISPQAEVAKPIDIVAVLLQEQDLIQAEILDMIPNVTELLSHLLWQAPLVVENMACAVGSPAAVRQAQALLENLTVQVANAVVQPLLNRFANTEVVKQQFYDRRLLSTRDVERFRNALSWRYRMRRWVNDPKAMFESQYLLIVFGETGLRQTSIYAARDAELQQLSGWPFLVTLALETRDAIAPPLRATFTVLGRGVVYVLTQFVGRGLGLVGRGIIQGIGSTWADLHQGQPQRRAGK